MQGGKRYSTAVTEAETDPSGRESHPFLQYYGQLSHQQNMLQDLVRTGTYQRAMLDNPLDFKNKVVLDVGCGTGILSIFAAQAGAKKVYAVEASDMADMARKLVEANGWRDVIEIVKGKVEEIELPEDVDVIVSEPLGFLLVHERMLESYIVARQRFLRPASVNKRQQMFPTVGTIKALPFSDWQLYHDLQAKSQFWHMNNFYGVDLTALEGNALAQLFSQPVIGYFDPSILIARDDEMATHAIDFRTATVEELAVITMPFRYRISKTSLMHGLACWFDADFLGSQNLVTLTTSPRAPGTHWYQVRLLLAHPLAVNSGQFVSGVLTMRVNKKFSYDVVLEAQVEGTRETIRSVNHIALHDPYYHYLNPSAAASYQTSSSSSWGHSANATWGGATGQSQNHNYEEEDDVSSASAE